MSYPFPSRRLIGAILIATLALAGGFAVTGAFKSSDVPVAPAAAPLPSGDEAGPTPLEVLEAQSGRAPLEKIDDRLQSLIDIAPRDHEEYVVIKSAQALELGELAGWSHSFTWPAGEHITVARAKVGALKAIAALPGVADVKSGDPEITREIPGGPDPDFDSSYEPVDTETLRARADAAPDWSETAAALAAHQQVPQVDGGANPQGWFDVRHGHAATEAWDMGYRGEGVRVGVMDTSVDFGHDDLRDTWAVMPEGTDYAGWPQVYDPFAFYVYTLQMDPDAPRYNQTGTSGFVNLYQESEVQEIEFDGELRPGACFEPRMRRVISNTLVWGNDPLTCEFQVPDTSQSGTIRYGHHPDGYLTRLGANEERGTIAGYAGVIAVDENQAGVYDTVYVDLDGDWDFTDEKPVTQASPLSWRDVDGDTISDVSGGLLYWIADGENPLPSSWIWGLEDEIPEAGSYVAFHYDTGGHGTLCASNVVSQGRIGVPPEINLKFRDLPGDGEPASMNPGMAPDAEMVAIGSIYSGPIQVMQSAWVYASFGTDKDSPADDIQITSNSYGFSGGDNDGWENSSRMIDNYVRTYAPNTAWMFSTGNGGPGYMTLAPPSPATGMGIGASTQMGSTGWDSITDTTQITYGDVTPFSNRGPGADGRNGPSVAADGAYAAGAAPVNSRFTNASLPETRQSGAYANQTWGGTSRAAPIAAGNMALIYQAFHQANDRWPTWQEAASLMMSGARYAAYDTFTMGAGIVDAADSVRIASGEHGIYAMPPEWTAGDYQGERFPAFAKLMHPGDSSSTTISLNNPSAEPIEVTLSAKTLRRIGFYEDLMATAPITDESPYNFGSPDYLKAIDESQVPEGTELLIARGRYPLTQLDPIASRRQPGPHGGDYVMDNNFRMAVYQHTDLNDNGRLWEDKDGDGAVDHADMDCEAHPDTCERGLESYTAVDYITDTTEIDQWEYMRFAYDSGSTNNWDIPVHHPLERWSAGLYIGLWHRCTSPMEGSTCNGRTAAVPTTDLSFRVDFYQYQDWEWLGLDSDGTSPSGLDQDMTVTIPAGESLEVPVTLSVPADAPYGSYQGAIFADYPRGENDEPVPTGGGYELDHLRTVIPVNANVAAQFEWTGSITLGGPAAADQDDPYNNGVVRGNGDWGWRPEAGDWRSFWIDAGDPDPGAHWILRSRWDDAVGETDIDTLLYGPAFDAYSNGVGSTSSVPDASDEDVRDPEWYGPHTLDRIAGSPNRNLGAGTWAYDTSSGENEDWLSARGGQGLHEVLLHNVLFSGRKFEVPFETTVASARLSPSILLMEAGECLTATMTSGIDMPGFSVDAVGLSTPTQFADEEIAQDDPDDPTTATFKHTLTVPEGAIEFIAEVTGEDGVDLDLFVLRDRDEDGVFVYDAEVVGESTTPTANERVQLSNPPAGEYQIWVQGWEVSTGTTLAQISIEVLAGDQITVVDAPPDIVPHEPNEFQVCLSDDEPVKAGQRGLMFMGPAAAPKLLTVDVRVQSESIYLPMVKREASPSEDAP